MEIDKANIACLYSIDLLAASLIKLCMVYFIQILLYLELLHLVPKCVHV